MVRETLFEYVTGATDVSLCSGVDDAVSVGIGIAATAVVGVLVLMSLEMMTVPLLLVVVNGVAVVMVIGIDGGAVTAVIDIIDDGSFVIFIRNIAIAVFKAEVLADSNSSSSNINSFPNSYHSSRGQQCQ